MPEQPATRARSVPRERLEKLCQLFGCRENETLSVCQKRSRYTPTRSQEVDIRSSEFKSYRCEKDAQKRLNLSGALPAAVTGSVLAPRWGSTVGATRHLRASDKFLRTGTPIYGNSVSMQVEGAKMSDLMARNQFEQDQDLELHNDLLNVAGIRGLPGTTAIKPGDEIGRRSKQLAIENGPSGQEVVVIYKKVSNVEFWNEVTARAILESYGVASPKIWGVEKNDGDKYILAENVKGYSMAQLSTFKGSLRKFQREVGAQTNAEKDMVAFWWQIFRQESAMIAEDEAKKENSTILAPFYREELYSTNYDIQLQMSDAAKWNIIHEATVRNQRFVASKRGRPAIMRAWGNFQLGLIVQACLFNKDMHGNNLIISVRDGLVYFIDNDSINYIGVRDNFLGRVQRHPLDVLNWWSISNIPIHEDALAAFKHVNINSQMKERLTAIGEHYGFKPLKMYSSILDALRSMQIFLSSRSVVTPNEVVAQINQNIRPHLGWFGI